jgi:hypothetical protein
MGDIAVKGRYAFRKYNTAGVSGSGLNLRTEAEIFEFVDQVDADEAALDARLTINETLALLGTRPPKPSARLMITTATSYAAIIAGSTHDGIVVAAGDRVARNFNGAAGDPLNGIVVVQASGAALRADQCQQHGAGVRQDAGCQSAGGVSRSGKSCSPRRHAQRR